MTVMLRGKGGRLDVTETDVETVIVTNSDIVIEYKKPYKYGLVCGCKYYAEEYEFVSCTVK